MKGIPSKLNLSSDEKTFFGRLFKECDPQNDGFVPGDVAANFMQRSRVPMKVLEDVRIFVL